MPSCLMAAEEVAPGFASSSDLFWKTLVALVFIVLLLFVLAALGQKFLAGKAFGQSSLKLLGGLTLGPREQIVLVEAGEDLLVIGIVPGQIRTLHRMKKDSASGLPTGANTQDSSLPASFASAPFTRALVNAIRRLRTPHEKT